MAISRRTLLCAAAGGCGAIPAVRAQEAQWPGRPLRIIVPTAPGGSPDLTARLLGDKIAGRLGQPVVVESMTAGGGIPGLQLVSNAGRDGYTYAMLTGGFATQAAVIKKLPYRPLDDFSFISSVVRYPIIYAVAPDSPIGSFKDYIERAKTRSNAVSNAIAAAGSVYHLLGKWIDNLADVEVGLVFYRGTAAALQDLLGGRVDVLTDAATSIIPRIRSGQVRALAVSSAERYPLLPDVPTMAETLPGIHVESWLGLASAPDSSIAIVDRLNSEIHNALNLRDVKAWATESGVIPAPSTPEEFRKRVQTDIEQWTEIVTRNNITI